ncbi:hypothetical protein A2382_00745 [Candidatus Woesebacteria bacterium RIFOXYB1_FULL_38_16]|uniref:Glycosyltransferase RgtA/B/C/D-like domain-containing protein n=1 Tax=Candidatus Woesebacteria bacterium RIFOXYB1_FULL_38_16 TaxID=1802538 RepID=A0A1F8CU79_9BACT|nr:MAG: hypothetical protein A2382_00745 [Candidatus Woesebacteria bacterium RIFOXYB1_FULL_38_16]
MAMSKRFLLTLIIPILFFIYALVTLSDYGINWDEPYHYRRGQAYLHYFLTGQKTYENMPKYPPLKGTSDHPNFRNSQQYFEAVQKNPSLSDPNFKRSFYQDDAWDGIFFIDESSSQGHPALNDILAALFNKIFFQKLGILDDLEAYHLFIVFTIFLATLFVSIFMAKEYGLIESIFATLAFASYPLILGEQHFNIKDPVETAFFTITLLSAYWGVKKNRFSWLLISALFFGLALSTKFNILFGIIPLLIWFFSQKLKLTKKIIWIIFVSPIIILVIFILSNPVLWANPIQGLAGTLKFYTEVGLSSTPLEDYTYFGFLNTYPTIWIIYTTPPILIFLFIFSIVFAKKLYQKNNFIILLFAWFVVVLARYSLFKATTYGGVRIIMEFVPALAMLTGISAGYLIRLKKTKAYLFSSFCLLLISATPSLVKTIKIHPHENVYFNFMSMGLAGAKAKNIPYWGDSYGNAYYEGLIWLNQYAERNAKLSLPIGITSNIPRFKLRPDIAVSPFYWSALKHDGEYLIELTHNYEPRDWFALKYLENAMEPVYEVRVDNVAIAKVWKNSPEYVKEEFKNQKNIPTTINANPAQATLTLELPQKERIMSVHINQPTEGCEHIQTGYLTSSIDKQSWVREKEDIAVDQLNRQAVKKLEPKYEYFFVAREAKTIVFYVGNPKSCLLKATSASATVLVSPF